jgi:carboxypeptidase Taq
MSNSIKLAYGKLLTRIKDLILLQSVDALVAWDMETMMPPKAGGLRSEQLALLSSIYHRMATDKQVGKLVNELTTKTKYDKLTHLEKRNVYLIKKSHEEQTKLPEKLVEEIARQQAIAVNTWKKAKAVKDFKLFEPQLEKLVSLKRKEADILMQAKQSATPYDALIDLFEPKMTANQVAPIFKTLQKELKNLLKRIEKSHIKPDMKILKCPVPVETQKKIATTLTEFLGYDTKSPEAGGRLDETEHPFTNGYYDDVRITTHYYENNFASSIFSVLHETGHALYEQNLKKDWKYQPIGMPCSYGIHESQSRLVENIVGRSEEFWSYFLPKLKKIANPNLNGLKLGLFLQAINEVKPTKIRVEADEVTYNMHIIIRFEIEQDLFSGKIEVDELPGIWNQKYKEYLGLEIENDTEGVMQDTHWASGLFGYFPSYSLGNIYSGQMMKSIDKTIPKWEEQLSKGILNDLKGWLEINVYSAGNEMDPADLMKKITGTSLEVTSYLNYLTNKYSNIYEL